MVNLYKFGLDLLVPTPQIVYLYDFSEIFTMCWWHIEVVVNWVVEYALYSTNCKKSMLNEFFVKMDVFFACRKFNLSTEIWEKYHQICNEISQKIAVSEFFFENISFWEFCKIDIWQKPLAFFVQWTKEYWTAVVCCREYKRNSFSLNNKSIQAAKYNPL